MINHRFNVDEYRETVKEKMKLKYAIQNQEWLVRDSPVYDNNVYELVFGRILHPFIKISLLQM